MCKRRPRPLALRLWPFAFLLGACSVESISFGPVPAPVLAFVSPSVIAPEGRMILVGQNFDLTPEDPNDLPGSAHPTPFPVEVEVAGQIIPFSSGDTLASTFATVRLPNLAPGTYPVRIIVNGQSSEFVNATVDDFTSLSFEADPVTLDGLGGGTSLKVFAERFDGEKVEVTQTTSFSVDPPNLLAIGRTKVIAGLQGGDAVLTATHGLLADSITVHILSDDRVLSLSAPSAIALTVNEVLPLTLEGLTEDGFLVDLAAASLLTISDEEALLVERDAQGFPFATALAPATVTVTFAVSDSSLGEVSTTFTIEEAP